MLIVSTLMALIAALVNKDILEVEQSVKVIIVEVIIETIGHHRFFAKKRQSRAIFYYI